MVIQDGVSRWGVYVLPHSVCVIFFLKIRSMLFVLYTYMSVYLFPFYEQTSARQTSHYVSIKRPLTCSTKLIVGKFFRSYPTIRHHSSVFRGASIPSPEIAFERFARVRSYICLKNFLLGVFPWPSFVKASYSCIICIVIRLNTISFMVNRLI